MENIQRVTAHLAAQVADEPDFSRRGLTLIPTRDGRAWYVDANGNHHGPKVRRWQARLSRRPSMGAPVPRNNWTPFHKSIKLLNHP